MATNLHEEARGFWDRDAATYDDSPTHAASTTLEQAAWNAALVRLLPPAPAGVLDVGAGTGFLSLDPPHGSSVPSGRRVRMTS